MRNFEERRAEIFRRGEERIRKRKQTHRRVLTLCLPLFLVVLGSAVLLPEMLPDAPDAHYGVTNESDSLSCLYVSAEIISPEHSLSIEAPSAVANIAGTLEGLFPEDEDTAPQSIQTQVESTITNTAADSYRIILTASDGTQTVYTLIGNYLTNTLTQQSRLLTEQQATELMAVLGITE